MLVLLFFIVPVPCSIVLILTHGRCNLGTYYSGGQVFINYGEIYSTDQRAGPRSGVLSVGLRAGAEFYVTRDGSLGGLALLYDRR